MGNLMLKLLGNDIYLTVLSREDCKTLWNDSEYDFNIPVEEFNIGHSDEKAQQWFDEIQRLQGTQNVRLGIFLYDGSVIGDVALQEIDRINRKCTIGIGIAKIANRSKGYGQQAIQLMLDYGFCFVGMERIAANTMDINISTQKVLKKCGFVLEGTERRAVYLNGMMHDKLHYAILKEEYLKIKNNDRA